MPKIKDSIPEGFYDIFKPNHRETFFLYLRAIYGAVKDGRQSLKGITKDVCKCIINDIPSEEYDDEELPLGEFDNKYLAALIKKGWLMLSYDPAIGEDVIIFPQYSSIFVEVIFKLEDDIETLSEVSLREIHYIIHFFATNPLTEEGRRSIYDAINKIQEYCIKITSLRDVFQKKFESVLENDNDPETGIPTDIFEKYLGYDRYVRDNASNILATGEFNRRVGEIEELIAEAGNKISKEQDDYFELKLDATTDEERRYVEQEELKLLDIIGNISVFKKEVNSAERLFSQIMEDVGTAAKLAYQRAKFMNSMDNEEVKASLTQIISFLSTASEENKGIVLEKLGENLTVSSEFKILQPSGLKIQKRKKDRKFEPIYVDINDDAVLDSYVESGLFYEEKFSGQELFEFEQQHTVDGKVRINSSCIKTVSDVEKIIELWFQMADENRISVQNLSLSETPVVFRINNRECFEFNEFEYEREG